jgi:hypothetical protein
MMSSTVWAHLVLSPATLPHVFVALCVAPCYRVTWHCSSAKRVFHSAVAAL